MKTIRLSSTQKLLFVGVLGVVIGGIFTKVSFTGQQQVASIQKHEESASITATPTVLPTATPTMTPEPTKAPKKTVAPPTSSNETPDRSSYPVVQSSPLQDAVNRALEALKSCQSDNSGDLSKCNSQLETWAYLSKKSMGLMTTDDVQAPQSTTRTVFLPDGSSYTCSSYGNMTNCY